VCVLADIPDFYMRGYVIDLIKKIDLIGELEEILKISKINPQVKDAVERKVVIDWIDVIDTISKINPTATENVVVNRIDKITEISKINPTATEDVVVNRIDTLTTLKTLEKIGLIKSVGEVGITLVRSELLRNPSFETGDFTGWYADPDVTVVPEPSAVGAYSCKIPRGRRIEQSVYPVICKRVALTVQIKGEVAGDIVRIAWYDSVGTWRTKDLTVTTAWTLNNFDLAGDRKMLLFRVSAPDANAGSVWVDDFHTYIRDVYGGVGPLAVEEYSGVTAAANTEGLTCSVNNDYRQLVQFRATLGAAGEVRLEASHNGTEWFTLWVKTLDEAGSYCDWDFIAFPYFRVYVPTTGIDIEVNVRAVYV